MHWISELLRFCLPSSSMSATLQLRVLFVWVNFRIQYLLGRPFCIQPLATLVAYAVLLGAWLTTFIARTFNWEGVIARPLSWYLSTESSRKLFSSFINTGLGPDSVPAGVRIPLVCRVPGPVLWEEIVEAGILNRLADWFTPLYMNLWLRATMRRDGTACVAFALRDQVGFCSR